MKSSLIENKIREIAELKRDGVYLLKFNRHLRPDEARWMNQYLLGVFNKTGCFFIVLGPDAQLIDSESHVQMIEDIVHKVMIRHDLLRPS